MRSEYGETAAVLPLGFYSDKTEANTRKIYPVNVFFPSLPPDKVRLRRSYRPVALLPMLVADAENGLHPKSEKFRDLSKWLHHTCLSVIFESFKSLSFW